MKESFLAVFIRRPVLTLVLSIGLVVFGYLGLQRLPVRELPDVDATIVSVLTVYPGASASVIETEVTEPLEESIASVSGIRQITSESREQVSSISVEFVQGTDVDLAAQEVRDRVARVRGRLPDDVEEPVVSKQEASARPIMWVAFYSGVLTTEELTEIAENQVKDRLQTVPGVSSVIIGGAKRFAMRVALDSQKMAARGITVGDVQTALQTQSVELPSGRVENFDRELTIQTRGRLITPEEFNALVIRQKGDNVVRLRDIGQAYPGVEDERAVARFKSSPAVGLGIVRQSKSNTIEVADGVKARLQEILPSLTPGIQLDYPYDESVFVRKSIEEVWSTLWQAFLLVVVVIFVFLRSWRSTLIPSLAIPVSIVSTFGVLYMLGYSINTFTLLALVLAIGIVVDDAIVVLENTYRHIEEGMQPFAAAVKSIGEISFAVIATTASLVAVFLPLAFLGGLVGRLLIEFAVSLAVSVVVSSVVALTLTPMVSARLLKPIKDVKHGALFNFFEACFRWVERVYAGMLGFALKIRLVTVVVLLGGGLFGTYALFQGLDNDFLPSEDKGRMFMITLAPEGATAEYTDRMVRQVEDIMAANESVDAYFAAVALPFNGPGVSNVGFTFVRLDKENRPHVNDLVGGPFGLQAKLMTEVEGAIVPVITPKAVDVGFSQDYQLVLQHPDLRELDRVTQMVKGKLAQSGLLIPFNLRENFQIDRGELRVRINRDRASALGVSVSEISRTLQILFGGQDLAKITRNGKEYDVIVQLNRSSRLTPSDLETLYVRNDLGQLVQLSNVVSTEEGAGPNAINRFGRQRSATLEGTPVRGVTLGQAVAQTEELLAQMRASGELPPGVTHAWNGNARELGDTNAAFINFFILATVVVYLVLAAQFESFVHPFTVLLALPLGLLGAFGSLYVLSWVNNFGGLGYALANGWIPPEGASKIPDPVKAIASVMPRINNMNLNTFANVGLVLLIALVTKNSILLVEFANQRLATGQKAKDAMLSAGSLRLRPILMTSVSTIAGILPIALALGDASESRQSLGIVVVGGMITSTVLTLFVVPCVYTLFEDFLGLFRRRDAALLRQL